MNIQSYILPGLDPLEHLAMENGLVENLETGHELLIFYRNAPSVFIGRNQNPWKEVSVDAPVPFFRRTSGGGTVYHDEGNLNWAFIIPRHAHDQDAELEKIASGISSLGIAVTPGDRGGIYCSGAGQYAGRKVSGTARRFTPTSVLHHGTVLVHADMVLLHACLGGIETVEDHSIASVPASPVNLSEIQPGLSVVKVMEQISVLVSGSVPERLPDTFYSPSIIEQQKEKLTSSEWLFGSTPSFRVAGQTQHGRLTIQVRAGCVEAIVIPEAPGLEKKYADYLGKQFSVLLSDGIFNSVNSQIRR